MRATARVAVQGWAETTDMQAVELAKAFEGCGVAAIIVTDIARDGLKTGVNVELTGAAGRRGVDPDHRLGRACKNVYDITALKNRAGTPIEGAILGRALYDGDIDPDRGAAGGALDFVHCRDSGGVLCAPPHVQSRRGKCRGLKPGKETLMHHAHCANARLQSQASGSHGHAKMARARREPR